MKKIIILLCCIMAIMIASCSNSSQENDNIQIQTNITNDSGLDIDSSVTITPTIIPTIVKNINVENNDLLDNIKELCKCPRKFDTDGEQTALSFLIDKMTEYGYLTQIQEFPVYHLGKDWMSPSSKQAYFEQNRNDSKKFGSGKNFIASTANSEAKSTLYITAHYDTTEDTNGIKDNGSGVVVVMEIARQLQEIDLPINIKYIFFSAEEAGLQGSAYFVSHLTQEEKANTLGCINIDVVGEKGDNEIILKTYEEQINVLSILMDDFHDFHHNWSAASDHTSFYMGEIPAIYFADEKHITKDSTDDPLNEIEISKLKDLTSLICNFLIKFNISYYYGLLQNGYVKEYSNIPSTKPVMGYSLLHAYKVLRKNGSGSKTQYILSDSVKNEIIITEEDSRFIDENLLKEFENYNADNEHIKYKVIDDKNTIIQYRDEWVGNNYGTLEGNISVEKALQVIEGISDITNSGTVLLGLDK